MKKTILLALSVVTLHFGYAQEGSGEQGKTPHKKIHEKIKKTPEAQAQMQVTNLDSIVKLTADQKTKVYDASLKKANTIKAAKEKYQADSTKKSLMMEIKAARTTYKSELNAILTADQQAKLKQHHEEMKAKHEAKKAEKKTKCDAKCETQKKKDKPCIKEGDDTQKNDTSTGEEVEATEE